MKTVLFDFDRTLTKRDTLRPLAHYFAGEDRAYFGLVLLYVVLVLARFRIIDDKKIKECFLGIFVKGKELSMVNKVVRKYFEKNLESLLNRPVFDALVKHRNNRDRIFIVSANFDFFLEPLIQLWGIKGIICTETHRINGVFTGKVIGKTCKGIVKAERCKALFSPQELAGMIAYGDADDHEMLGIVGEAILVR